jgi:signal transduction histidine kinase
LIISGILGAFFNFQVQRNIIFSNQQLIAQIAANKATSFFQENFSIMETTARLMDPSFYTWKEQGEILSRLLGTITAFRQLVLLDTKRQKIAGLSRLTQDRFNEFNSRFGNDLFDQTFRDNKYISSVYVDKVSNEPIIIMAVPVKDVFRDLQGFLIAEMNLKFMWDLVEGMKVGRTGLAYVVDKKGKLIAFSDISRVLRGETVDNVKVVHKFIGNSTFVNDAEAEVFKGINGTDVVGSYVSLGVPDWDVITELPVSEANETVIRTLLIMSILIILMAVFACWIGIRLAQWLSVPIVKMMETAVRIAGGETELQMDLRGPKEIISLGMAFNSMTTQLRDMINTLEERVALRTRNLEQAYETLQKQHQILLITEKMASLGRLIAGIAHEMSTPLASVRAALVNLKDLVKEYEASIDNVNVTSENHHEIAHELHSVLQLADKSVDVAAGFLRGIKSQISNSASQESSPINAVVAIEDALLLLKYALIQGKCDINFEKSDDQIQIVGKPGRLEQVVTNLVNNAIDASYPHGGLITIRLEKQSRFVVLQVSDHGTGILPENLSKIFDPMFSTKPFGSSTGLGLTIIHDIIVGEFGGTIDVTSTPGHGATFTLCIPL